MKSIFVIIIILVSAWASYLQFFEMPRLISELKAWEEAVPDTVRTVTPGKIDTLYVIKEKEVFKTLIDSTVNTSSDTSSLNSYKTYFGDQYLSGIVDSRVDGILESVEVEYYFKREIASTRQTNTIETVVTRNVVKFREVPAKGLSLGAFLGVDPRHTYFGPSVGYQDGKGNNFSYSYDALNKGHFITYQRNFSFPKISLF